MKLSNIIAATAALVLSVTSCDRPNNICEDVRANITTVFARDCSLVRFGDQGVTSKQQCEKIQERELIELDRLEKEKCGEPFSFALPEYGERTDN